MSPVCSEITKPCLRALCVTYYEPQLIDLYQLRHSNLGPSIISDKKNIIYIHNWVALGMRLEVDATLRCFLFIELKLSSIEHKVSSITCQWSWFDFVLRCLTHVSLSVRNSFAYQNQIASKLLISCYGEIIWLLYWQRN